MEQALNMRGLWAAMNAALGKRPFFNQDDKSS